MSITLNQLLVDRSLAVLSRVGPYLSWVLTGTASKTSTRLVRFEKVDIYIYYIHPELRIRDYRFGSGKGAGSL